MTTEFSQSENHGLEVLGANALNIYSVGISTGGIAEMRMETAQITKLYHS